MTAGLHDWLMAATRRGNLGPIKGPAEIADEPHRAKRGELYFTLQCLVGHVLMYLLSLSGACLSSYEPRSSAVSLLINEHEELTRVRGCPASFIFTKITTSLLRLAWLSTERRRPAGSKVTTNRYGSPREAARDDPSRRDRTQTCLVRLQYESRQSRGRSCCPQEVSGLLLDLRRRSGQSFPLRSRRNHAVSSHPSKSCQVLLCLYILNHHGKGSLTSFASSHVRPSQRTWQELRWSRSGPPSRTFSPLPSPSLSMQRCPTSSAGSRASTPHTSSSPSAQSSSAWPATWAASLRGASCRVWAAAAWMS